MRFEAIAYQHSWFMIRTFWSSGIKHTLKPLQANHGIRVCFFGALMMPPRVEYVVQLARWVEAGQIIIGSLGSLFLDRWQATLKASEAISFIRAGCPRPEICNKNLTTALSSNGMRYCWLWAFCSFERRPCARWWKVVRAASLSSTKAAYILRMLGGRPKANTWLAQSMLTYSSDSEGKAHGRAEVWKSLK